MQINHTPILLVAILIVLSGCVGGGGSGPTDGAAENEQTTMGASGATGGQAADGGSSTDWCDAGQSMQYANPGSGERVAWTVQGIVQMDGRQVCKATWTTNQGDVRRMELFFSKDETYRKMISYDAGGKVINEMQLVGDDPTADGTSSDMKTAESEDAWCSDASSMQFMNPQTGEQVAWKIHGIVEEDGKEVCKAVWTTNQGEISRIEMYFSEDESYRKMVTYDADGNLESEIQMGSG